MLIGVQRRLHEARGKILEGGQDRGEKALSIVDFEAFRPFCARVFVCLMRGE